MPQLARMGDTGVGVCVCHKSPIGMAGVIVASEGVVFADNMPVARVGDIVVGGCGHIGIIVSGAGVVYADGIQTARVGDSFVGCFSGTIVSGSGVTDAQ